MSLWTIVTMIKAHFLTKHFGFALDDWDTTSRRGESVVNQSCANITELANQNNSSMLLKRIVSDLRTNSPILKVDLSVESYDDMNQTNNETTNCACPALRAEMQSKDDIIEFLSQPIINEHNFPYIYNASNVCNDSDKIDLLLVVPSAPENFQRRYLMRISNMYKYVTEPSQRMKILFFLGKYPKWPERRVAYGIQKSIDKELNQFQDMVQEDFEDVYKNIRLKAVSMLRWVHTFCRNARFVVRIDDDVKMPYTQLFPVISWTSQKYKNFILGNRKAGWEPHRHNGSKYYLSEEEFPDPVLPPFALGGVLAYPTSTVSLLYQAALRVKPIWLDDIYITGICAPKVGVPVLYDPIFNFKHKL
ncbi:lactosylceramide -n-acetyl-beta-d-glucosaminyltransferase [Biomphalaria glabrata]|nr:lactosylceramide -n-acetyl-beta-d-glucosaminyltransferase-like lactosylceramide 1; 3-N-acetyl-beta-D-glucosaminyltransferase-like P Biomineralization/Cytoskeleton/Tissue growth [Biomphalaria glabrata]